MAKRLLQSSAARLALLYVGVFMLAVGALLGAVLLIAQRELAREVDLVIATELEGLRDEYEEGGLQSLVETLNRRTDSWGRSGAVYMLIDASGNRVAGNLSAWPEVPPGEHQWVEFDLTAREHGAEVDHPVRAGIYTLDAHRLLVGTDVSERRKFAARGCARAAVEHAARGAAVRPHRLVVQRRVGARARRGLGLRAHHLGRHGAAPARGPVQRRVRPARDRREPRARSRRAADRRGARDLQQRRARPALAAVSPAHAAGVRGAAPRRW
jgi:hypothetical protein